MAGLQRTSEATWNGDLRGGKGTIDSTSGVLKNTSYSFASRFEQAGGTNPEELLAAAHAACYSMALSATLGAKGHNPTSVHTIATCTVAPKQGGGFAITTMHLETRGDVPGIDDATFKEIAKEAEQTCPVSNALRGGVEISLDAALA